jgi:hypothetical protein
VASEPHAKPTAYSYIGGLAVCTWSSEPARGTAKSPPNAVCFAVFCTFAVR